VERRFALPREAPAAEQAWVLVRLDKASGTVADRYTLDIEASGPAGWSLAWPAVEEDVAEFSVASMEERPARGVPEQGTERGARLVEEKLFVLEPFLAGQHSIPAMTFNFRNGDPAHVSVISISTTPIEVEVASVLGGVKPGEAPALEPMRGVVDLAAERVVPMWAVVSGAGVLLISVAGIALVAARRKHRVIEPLGPAETARARLKELTAQDLPAFGKFEGHYVELADILRRFAAARYGLPEADRTTEELLNDMKGVPGAEADELRGLLGHLDEVKFTGAIPTAATAQQALDWVVRYVEEHAADAAEIAGGDGPHSATAPVAAADGGRR
jgi:hypothetical protein